MAKGSGWTVTSQLSDQFENTGSGQTVVGVRIYFITGDGNEGSVFIPNNHYTTRNVKERIAAQAALLDEIGSLTEGMG